MEISRLSKVKEFVAKSIDLPLSSVNDVSGGVKNVSREDYLEATSGNFSQLVGARRSVRHYSSEPVSLSILEEAVKLAQQSPSVCNRQGAKVWWVLRREKIDQILLQTGIEVGHLAKVLLIVT